MSFSKGIKEAGDKKDAVSKRRAIPKWQIIALLILFFPVGLYLLWQQDRWPKRTKKIVTWVASTALVAFLALIIIFAPPTVTITSSLASVKPDFYELTGKVSPAGSIVTVNGVQAKVVGDTFSNNVRLKEGDNILKVVVVSGSKRTEQEFKIHRYTKSEVITQEKAAAKKKIDAATAQAKNQQVADAKSEADVAAAKKKADDTAAEQAKKQAADAKAKIDAAAATQKATPVATPAPTVTVSQKNALSKAKSYISYTAFSHDGLADQLVYEQFSTADATYGADNVGANWNEQAAKKAKDYMSYSSFSRGSLIDQLQYDKFTLDQATYGVNSVGL
jgi:hypothetical protein